MAGMAKKDVRRVLDSAEEQGCTLIATRKGVLIRHPDGVNTTIMHWSTSDFRTLANTRADFRRMGLTWPFDPTRPKCKEVDENGGSRGRVEVQAEGT